MLYFKNNDLAEAHHVSLRTVLNWIEAAKNGKLDLLLHEHNGKSYVANTTRNIATIEAFVEERRKYRNTKSFKVLRPKSEFYELYNKKQILDIISHLDIYHEIPRQYNYFKSGADYWDSYAHRLDNEKTPNILNRTKHLLVINKSYIDDLAKRYKRVNVIDVGVGNALPVRDFLKHLIDLDLLGQYIAIDISQEMLTIAEKNIHEWFGEKVTFKKYQLDITHDRFQELVAEEHIKSGESTANFILLFGCTSSNLRSPDNTFQTIHDSMGRHDYLFHAVKLDTPNSRNFFDFSSVPGQSKLSSNHRFLPDLLNIDEALYEVEAGFDENIQQRYIRIKFKVAVTFEFTFQDGKQSVNLHKDDTILLWRCWHQMPIDVIEQLTRNDFNPLLTSQTEDKEYMLTISKIKH